MIKHGITYYSHLLQKSTENIEWYWNAANEYLNLEWYQKYDQKEFHGQGGSVYFPFNI